MTVNNKLSSKKILALLLFCLFSASALIYARILNPDLISFITSNDSEDTDHYKQYLQLRSFFFINLKNYLAEKEIGDLNLLVSAFLDLAEFQARRKQIMNMSDWLERTNKFLESNSLDVLPNAGTISHEQAIDKAHSEYEVFRIEQDKKYVSDLDEVIKKMEKGN